MEERREGGRRDGGREGVRERGRKGGVRKEEEVQVGWEGCGEGGRDIGSLVNLGLGDSLFVLLCCKRNSFDGKD